MVSKCLTCSLAMDGKPDHEVTFGDYTLHLCSDHCVETFSNDPELALSKVKIPGSEG